MSEIPGSTASTPMPTGGASTPVPLEKLEDGTTTATTTDPSSGGSQDGEPCRCRTSGRFLDRLEHFTWANYTFPMATGGIALLLSDKTQAYNFTGLQTIGKVVYIFDLCVFTFVTACISYRFARFKGALKASLTNPHEAIFLGTSCLSTASIITAIARYGIPSCGPWLVVAFRILFWLYFAVAFCIAVGQYYFLAHRHEMRVEDMSPGWILPIFPFMLCGTIASAGAADQPADQALPMIMGGLAAQGLGMLVAMLIYSTYVWRLLQFGFPRVAARPAMFIAVGPPSFTSLALIGLANDYPAHYAYWGPDDITGQVLQIVATLTSVFIWTLSLWFFFIAAAANLAVRRELAFRLNWWAYVFPNVGFTITVLSVGKSLESPGIKWVGTVMSILLICTWLFVFFNHVRAIVRREIWFEGRDEDYVPDAHKPKHG